MAFLTEGCSSWAIWARCQIAQVPALDVAHVTDLPGPDPAAEGTVLRRSRWDGGDTWLY